MASHGDTEYSTAPGNDYVEHVQTYDRFLLLTTIAIGHVVSVAIALAIGGVKGSWGIAAMIILGASFVAVHGIATGAKMPIYITVVLALVVLALA